MRGARTVLLAGVAGVGVGVIYLPQPLLPLIASDLGVSAVQAAPVLTAIQIGYALGLLLFVPLSDRLHPYKQAAVQAVVTAAAWIGSAFTQDLVLLCVAMFLAGLSGPFAQIVLPATVRAATSMPSVSVAAIMSGSITIGIFGGRLVAGAAGEVIGWRGVFIVAAALVGLAGVAVSLERGRTLGDRPIRSYPALLAGLPHLLFRTPRIRNRALTQGVMFATMQTIWAIMTLHLVSPAIGWSVGQAGAAGAVGIASGLAVLGVGTWLRRSGRRIPVLACTIALTVGVVLLGVVAADPVALLAVTFGVALCIQACQSTTQSEAIDAAPGSAASANAVFMGTLFACGTVGIAVGVPAYEYGGYPLVSVLLACFAATAVVLALLARRDRIAEGPDR